MAATLLGVDVGGTNMKIACINHENFTILEKEMISTEALKGFPDVLDRMIVLIEKHRTKDTISIGVCVAGPIEQPAGVLVRAPNIPDSERVDLKSILEKTLKTPVAVANDAQCFTLAEATLGSGKGHSVVCGITIGTGVGGGVCINGNIFTGAHGYAAEIGHMLLRPGEPPYKTNDCRGSVEQFLSGTAFAERCKAAASPEEYLHGDACAFLYPEIFKEVAWMCTNVIHAYDPSVIIFGGSTGKALKPHLQKIEQELTNWLLPSMKAPKLTTSYMEHPGTIGAALLSQI